MFRHIGRLLYFKIHNIKNRMKLLLIIGLLLCSHLVAAQQLPIWNPTLGRIADLSEKAEIDYQRWSELFVKWMDDSISEEENSEKESLEDDYGFNEAFEGLEWAVQGGCSWYCAGGPDSVWASSYLSSQSDNTYLPENAHDLNLKLAWVEGTSGYGEGEWITYRFKPNSPRITEIRIYNGYVKSEKAWNNNSRVKKLKLYMNNEAIAILYLQDTHREQIFTLPKP